MKSTMTKQRVVFLGLGLMGSGMARRILTAGFPLTVFNRNRDKAAALTKEGACIAESAREAAAAADVIVSMVADDNASRAMWLGENGALAGVTTDAVLIESSTITPGWVKELAAAALARGCELIDAPVTGSKNQAAAGELNFLVGGSETALEKARPVLSAMSRSITHLGVTGSGALLKLLNNFLCGVQAASFAEAMVLIERSGLDRAKALEVLLGGAPGSGLGKTVTPRMTARDYTPNFLLKLMAKDLGYALKEGERHSVPMKTAGCALEIFKRAIAGGDGDKDFSAVVETIRNPGGPAPSTPG
jgi:3-hydroxyisobutyrate dehydrogenase